MENTITLKEWKAFVEKNSESSYSLAVCAAILLLWEENAFVKQTEDKVLTDNLSGLSGAQASMAINFARDNKPEWMVNETN